jgi:hypothetical protein
MRPFWDAEDFGRFCAGVARGPFSYIMQFSDGTTKRSDHGWSSFRLTLKGDLQGWEARDDAEVRNQSDWIKEHLDVAIGMW